MPLLILLAVPAVLVLQRRLSRRPQRWPGLVLPLLCFVFSLGFCAWLGFFSHPSGGYVLRTADGLYHHFDTLQDANRFAEKQTDGLLQFSHPTSAVPAGALALRLGVAFAAVNAVTAVLLFLYWRARRGPRLHVAKKKRPG
ncbi:hypothetical protein [Allofournierella sp.]|uniref:hypothetical protein n=1 Tax=Allofournierella sp. TaxID=1940256 RepID=UPI003AB5C91F